MAVLMLADRVGAQEQFLMSRRRAKRLKSCLPFCLVKLEN